MVAVVILVGIALVIGVVVFGALWLRRSGLLPGWLTSNELKNVPSQLLFVLSCLLLPFIAFPWLLVYVLRERRRQRPTRVGETGG